MDPRLAAVAERGEGWVAGEALEVDAVPRGVIRWAVRRGELVPLGPGAWCTRERWDGCDGRARHLLVLRAALARRPTAVAAAGSAAVLWRLPLPAGPPAEPVTLTRRATGRRGADGVKGGSRSRRAWLESDEVTASEGLPVTTPARTVVDLVRAHDLPWSLAFADAALRGGTAAADLASAARRRPFAPGHRRAVLVAGVADQRSESPLESLARGVMLVLGLPSPELQVPIATHRGRFRADLAVPGARVLVEADGRVKYTGAGRALDGVDPDERRWRDKLRADALHDAGWEVVRFTMADLGRPQEWGRRFEEAARRSARRHGLALPLPGSADGMAAPRPRHAG